uniref:Putative kunitz-domain-containing protein n=1 Tax=Amblyomma americanum TaxID=6943 RepID=A0A0C9R5V2_AMBAM
MREQVLVALLVIFPVKATHSVLTRGTTSLVKGSSCMRPPMETELRCNADLHRYYYGNKNHCHHFQWNGCMKQGVYEMRVDCVLKCNADKDPGICLLPPEKKCARKSSTVAFLDRYFYNYTSRACEAYRMCGVAGEEFTQNTFGRMTLCLMHCSGFPVNEETKRDAERRRTNYYAGF